MHVLESAAIHVRGTHAIRRGTRSGARTPPITALFPAPDLVPAPPQPDMHPLESAVRVGPVQPSDGVKGKISAPAYFCWAMAAAGSLICPT